MRPMPGGIGLALQMTAGKTNHPGEDGTIRKEPYAYIGSDPAAMSKQVRASIPDPSKQYNALASVQSGMPIGAKTSFPNGNQVEYKGIQDDGTHKIAVHVPGQDQPVEKSIGSADADHLLMQWATQQKDDTQKGDTPSEASPTPLQGVLASIASQ